MAANDAANRLFAIPAEETLIGRAIADYLPVLSDALQLENVPDGFRTAAQCQGRRADGNIFLAHTWFSSYLGPEGVRLAAIVVDSSEEMRDREEQNLRLLHHSNRITAAAVSHELRTLCGAIALVSAHLSGKRMEDSRALGDDEDFQALANLVEGLKKLASLELRARAGEAGDLQELPLKRALDELRIVIESDWQGIDGAGALANPGQAAGGSRRTARPPAGFPEPGAKQPSGRAGVRRPRTRHLRRTAGRQGSDSLPR